MKYVANKKRSSKKAAFIVLAAFVVIFGALTVYLVGFNGSLLGFKLRADPQTNVPFNTEPPTEDQKTTGESIKQQTIDEDTKVETAPEDTTDTVTIVITSPTEQSESDGFTSALIRTNIQDIKTNTGNCTLTLTMGDQVIARQSEVQALPSYTTCKGFDIPMSELTTGTWLATVSFKNDQYSGSVSQSITIKRSQ